MDFIGNVINGNSVTPAEKQLRPLLLNECIQVLSNFEMNQIASLTYNDLSCDGIFELIETICRKPLDHTPLTIQKSLIITKHIVIYGAENTVNHAYGIQDFISPLRKFNTVLMRRKQGGPMSFLQNLQGGGVDKGGPVREAAEDVIKLLSDINELRKIRLASACQDSLVPIGDDKIAFVTDEVRFHVLKRRIQQQNRMRIQSNLKDSACGFGAGYASKDGKNVVGAAHGIDEMIKMANLQTKRFSDKGSKGKTPEELILEELKAEAEAEKAALAAANTPTVDLLGTADLTPPVGDLMDFGASPSGAGSENAAAATADLLGGIGNNTTATTADLLGGALGAGKAPGTTSTDDPFGFSSTYNTTTTQLTAPVPNLATNNLLDIATQNDPFTSSSNTDDSNSMSLLSMTTNAINTTANINSDPMASTMQVGMQMQMQMSTSNTDSLDTTGMMNGLSSTMTTMSLSEPPPKPPVMGSNEDRFSALDALADTGPTSSRIIALDAKNAENRLLGFGLTPAPEVPQPPTSNGVESSLSAPMSMGVPMGVPMGMPPPPPVHQTMIAPGSDRVAPRITALSDAKNAENRLLGFGSTPAPEVPQPPTLNGAESSLSAPMSMGVPMGMPPPPPVHQTMIAPGSGQVAAAYGGSGGSGEDDDNPWVMGGSMGMGLEPVGPVPSAPPPPPPPDF